jgi:ATP-dependent RNA circularization protein (DNA/RNA ligase family)
MQSVLTRAVNLNVTEREELLKSYGLHNFKVLGQYFPMSNAHDIA